MVDSFFYKDSQMVHLWCHLLIKTNHKNNTLKWNGKKQILSKGQLLTGRNKLSEETGISSSKVYRILKCFESEQLIEQQKTTKFTIITIRNYEIHQSSEQRTEQQLNNKRTTTEQQVNTNNNDNNDNNDNNRGIFKPPSLEAIETYCKSRNNNVNPQAFFNHYKTNGWVRGKTKMKDWQACIELWESSEPQKRDSNDNPLIKAEIESMKGK